MRFLSVLWHYWRQEGYLTCEKVDVGVCWRFNWSFARLIVTVVTTTSIILSPNKIQNGDILYRLTQVHLLKWLSKRSVRVFVHVGRFRNPTSPHTHSVSTTIFPDEPQLAGSPSSFNS